MKLRYLFIFFLIIITVAVGAWFESRTREKPSFSQKLPLPTVYVEPPPRSIDFPITPSGTIFEYVGSEIQIPTTLPLYAVTQDVSINALMSLAESLSTRLGFAASPSAVISGDTFSYLRNEKEKSFVLSKTKNIIAFSYQQLRAPAGISLSPPELSANAFVHSVFSLPQEISLKNLGAFDDGFDGLVVLERPVPGLFGYTWGFSVGGYGLLTQEYSPDWIQSVVDERGVIRSMSYVIPPTKLALQGTTAVISLTDAVANLNAGRGALVGVTQGEALGYGTTPAFVNAKILNAALYYLVLGSALHPAYFFEGAGTTASGATQQFIAVVMASAHP